MSTYSTKKEATLIVNLEILQRRNGKRSISLRDYAHEDGLALFRGDRYAGYSVKNRIMSERSEFYSV